MVLWGRCLEGPGAEALWPWIEVLRAAAARLDDQGRRAVFGPRAGLIAELVPEVLDAPLRRAEPLHQRLAPMSDRFAIAGMIDASGSMSRPVGRLAELLGRHDQAIEAFEAARLAELTIGAEGFAARSALALAHALSARPGPGQATAAALAALPPKPQQPPLTFAWTD